jgi:hypothetical protein
MSFKIGQKVVCVSNKPMDFCNPYNDSLQRLVLNEIYTVKEYHIQDHGLVLIEVISSHPSGGYNSYRFRPIDETFGEETATRIEKEMIEELQPVEL